MIKFKCTSPPLPERKVFTLIAQSKEEEDAYDIASQRTPQPFTGTLGAIAHLVKGALGAGILSIHVAWMTTGFFTAVCCTPFIGMYIAYCLYRLIESAKTISKRTQIPEMSYPDIGEAAAAIFPNPKIAKFSKVFRYWMDCVICIDLFGACTCYQLIIAISIKQLVEDVQKTGVPPAHPGYPPLQIYLLAIIIPIICICLITDLRRLAPFSIIANFVVVACIGCTIYYSFQNHPQFEGLTWFTHVNGFFKYISISLFGMSCAGIVVVVVNNMENPNRSTCAIVCALTIITMFTMSIGFFGSNAYRSASKSPITLNFPITSAKVMKGLIAVMIYCTHALNYFTPFRLCWMYIKPAIEKRSKMDHIYWELIFRATFVILISILAMVFPKIDTIMSFLGAFCLSNMAFIWPHIIDLSVTWLRPGLGKFKWRLWKCLFLTFIGVVICVGGSILSIIDLFI